jgi:MFS family permease
MFYIAAIFALFYLVMVAATNVWMIFIGRFGTGLATGATCIVANVYIAETAAAKYRGFLGSCFQVCLS